MRISNSSIPCLPFVELKKAKTINTSTAVINTPAHSGSAGNSLTSASHLDPYQYAFRGVAASGAEVGDRSLTSEEQWRNQATLPDPSQ